MRIILIEIRMITDRVIFANFHLGLIDLRKEEDFGNFILLIHIVICTKSYKAFYNVYFMELGRVCDKCQGKKRIMHKNGSIGPCIECLLAGEMDQHSKNLKDSGIKI